MITLHTRNKKGFIKVKPQLYHRWITWTLLNVSQGLYFLKQCSSEWQLYADKGFPGLSGDNFKLVFLYSEVEESGLSRKAHNLEVTGSNPVFANTRARKRLTREGVPLKMESMLVQIQSLAINPCIRNTHTQENPNVYKTWLGLWRGSSARSEHPVQIRVSSNNYKKVGNQIINMLHKIYLKLTKRCLKCGEKKSWTNYDKWTCPNNCGQKYW